MHKLVLRVFFYQNIVLETKTKVMELMARYELKRSSLIEEIAKLTAPLKNPNKVN